MREAAVEVVVGKPCLRHLEPVVKPGAKSERPAKPADRPLAVDATQHKDILAFLFLKYISDVWRKHYEQFVAEYQGDPPEIRDLRIRRRLDRERFKLKQFELRDENGTVTETFLSDFYSLYERRNRDNVGELINEIMEAIEETNDPKLKGVFRNIDFNSEANLGQTRDRNRRLRNLIEDFAKPSLDLRDVSEDAIGEAYIFLIERFASDAGKKAGEFLHAAHRLRTGRQARRDPSPAL